MECQNRGSRRAPASRSSSSTHTPIDAFKGAAALGTRANTCIVARDLIDALPRPIAMRGEGRYCVLDTKRQPALVCTKDGVRFNPVECLPLFAECSCHFKRFPCKERLKSRTA